MKILARSIEPGSLFALILTLLTLPTRGAEARVNGTNDEPKRIEFVYVVGQVKIPQRYVYTNGMTVSSAVKLAKGVTDQASPTKLTLTREGKRPVILDRQRIENGKAKDIKLEPGDTIFVAKKE